MGIYIQDLALPTSEVEPLKFELYADGTVFSQKKADDIYEFHAIEVKPHGRLIDADAFEKDCRKRLCHECDNYNGVKCKACWVDDMIGEVTDAPTIVEAERGEE